MTNTQPLEIRYPRQAIADAITQALGTMYDFTTGTAWVTPPGCPGCATGSTCDLAAGLIMQVPDGCTGYMDANVRLPEDQAITIESLCAALPEPDSAGLVSAAESGNILGQLVAARLRNQDYRRQQAFRILGEAFDTFEETLSLSGKLEQPPAGALRCQVCSRELPAGSKASRRTCSDACRTKLKRTRARASSRQGTASVSL